MRIIAGIHKSRNLETLDGLNTRPMMDRMKESVFNTIGPFFEGDITLDLFGGSGALTLEALSRGCSCGYICELNKQASQVIRNNIKSLKEEMRVTLYNNDYKVILKKMIAENKKFDIIFLDPPYKLNLVDEIIATISDNDMLNDNGVIVCQYVTNNHQPHETSYLEILKNYKYGVSEVCIYQKKDVCKTEGV